MSLRSEPTAGLEILRVCSCVYVKSFFFFTNLEIKFFYLGIYWYVIFFIKFGNLLKMFHLTWSRAGDALSGTSMVTEITSK